MDTTRPPRRLVLTAVPRRDAAQRLSLAFCLLARENRTRPLALPPGQPSRGPVAREPVAVSRSLIQEATPPCKR
jgi:hypothetical protein